MRMLVLLGALTIACGHDRANEFRVPFEFEFDGPVSKQDLERAKQLIASRRSAASRPPAQELSGRARTSSGN